MIALALALLLQAPAPPPSGVTPLGAVTVDAPRPPPKLARTYPAAGATSPFGVLVLTVVFDQPMDPARFDTPPAGDDAPQCLGRWRLLPDLRTFVRLCSLTAGRSYRLRFGADASAGFRNVLGKGPEPFELAFTTEADKTDTSLEEALKSAGLKPEEGPIMDWRGRPSAPG